MNQVIHKPTPSSCQAETLDKLHSYGLLGFRTSKIALQWLSHLLLEHCPLVM